MDFAQKIYDALDGNSDKGEYHQYHTIYAATLPEKLNSFLEIGISITERPGQSSLYGWSKLYPNAEIIGLDNMEYKLINEGNIKSFLVDQSSAESLSKFASSWKTSIDAILDDGSHNIDHYLLTFEHLFPLLSDDGVYLIEDVWSGQVFEDTKAFFSNREDVYFNVHDKTETAGDSIIFEIRRLKK